MAEHTNTEQEPRACPTALIDVELDQVSGGLNAVAATAIAEHRPPVPADDDSVREPQNRRVEIVLR